MHACMYVCMYVTFSNNVFVSSPIVAEAKLCVSVFIDMERSAQLQSYYSQCHKVTTSYRI